MEGDDEGELDSRQEYGIEVHGDSLSSASVAPDAAPKDSCEGAIPAGAD